MTTHLVLATAVLCLILPTNSFAKDQFLLGRVVQVGELEELKPVVGQEVTLEAGDTARTKEGGRFRIFLKDVFKPGSRIKLLVEKEGWRIQYPLEGETRVPDDLEKEVIEIRLLPVGSKKFWSADRIEKFIRDMAEKAKTQVKLEGKPQDVDFSRYIKDWAVQYGFSPQQAKAEIDKWAAEAERKNDPYQLGLAAYAKKNFGEAGKLFEESAGEKVRRAHEASTTARRFTEEAIRDFRLAGDAHTNNYQFDQALVAYRKATELISRADQPGLWADLTVAVGVAAYEIGIRAEGDSIHQHLNTAVAAYRAALTVYTKEQLTQQWAAIQNNLGLVLWDQGTRTSGEAGARLLTEAVEAYKAALTVYTKAQLPQDWARTQVGLGTAFWDQGVRAEGKESARLLTEAVASYRAALTVYTKEQLPQQWAMTQNNLGLVLWDQGTRTSGEAGTRLLAEAVEAYKAALTVRTKAQLPQDWAGTQNNLGNVLRDQGIRTSGEAGTRLLAEAVEAYKAALTVRTKAQLPQDWAATSSNLAEALFLSGQFIEARDQLTMTLQYSDLDSGTRVALLAIEVATFVALDTPDKVQHSFETLQQALSKQIPDFSLTWSFRTIRLFIDQNQTFAKHQSWLLAFIQSLESKQRDEIQAAADTARHAFLNTTKP
jgi:tetratricopeptide (TPR) repeat protein